MVRGQTRHIRAAGAVCWRIDDHGLQVLIIHRPDYNDWSWPKGKADPGESGPVTAVREVREETGLTIRLGIELPTAHYPLGANVEKTVRYWAAHVEDQSLPDPPRPKEVDRCEWVSVDEAERRLSRRGDRLQLTAVHEAHIAGRLNTRPILIVRHAEALDRSNWNGGEQTRPLSTYGEQQAALLEQLLRAWRPERIYTSPWHRCVATIAPFARHRTVKVRSKKRLTEAAHRKAPMKVAKLVGKAFSAKQAAVICTHRPVLGTVLGAIAGRAGAGSHLQIPATDPFLSVGEIFVAHVSNHSDRVVQVERHLAEPGSTDD